MRNILCNTLLKYADAPDFVFLTGDLGFMALEPLQAAMGKRFVNVGVAEQNMISMSAGMATLGYKPWTYSIGPFIYARPYEQIRNDICLHNLPVRLIGNGGGYAYGSMGSTHHSLEDYGSLLCLPNMRVFVPAFAEDVPAIIKRINIAQYPAYLRLGRCEKPAAFELPPYSPWRKLIGGSGPVILVVGPLAGGILGALLVANQECPANLWVLTELPLSPCDIPETFLADLRCSGQLIVVEEHGAHGSAGQVLAHTLGSMGEMPKRFIHRHAQGYISGLYGSQQFHRKECGLDSNSIVALLKEC